MKSLMMLDLLRLYTLVTFFFFNALAAPQLEARNKTQLPSGENSPTRLGDPLTMTDILSRRMETLERIWPNPLKIKAIWAFPRNSGTSAVPGDFTSINIDFYDTVQQRYYYTNNIEQDPGDWTSPKPKLSQVSTGFKLFNWQQRRSTLEEQMRYLAEAGEPQEAYMDIGLYIPDNVHGLPLHLNQIYWLYHLGQNRRFGQGDLDHKVHGRSYVSSDGLPPSDAGLNLTSIEPEDITQVAK